MASTLASTPSSVRLAAAEFVRGTTFGWGRLELASWLVSHYSPCLAADAVVHPDGRGYSAPLSAASTHLDDERIERLILDARCSVLCLLSELPWPSRAAAMAKRAIGAGFVIAARNRGGKQSWAPVGRKRMRLAERVGSLFIADALDNPHDYSNLSLCRSCGELGFGAGAPAHESGCRRARHVA
ncbi:MAG: hypothetical protein J0I07_02430 [Myxococcales bacterium]|nr:hypothetical protein [Myxococcales bacterium]